MSNSKLTWRGDQIWQTLHEAMPGALFKDGERLVELAASKINSNTGTLAGSGYVVSKDRSTYKPNKRHRRELKPDGDAVAVAFAAYYAKFVELGTRKMTAKPYLRPAIDEMRSNISWRVARALEKSLKRYER